MSKLARASRLYSTQNNEKYMRKSSFSLINHFRCGASAVNLHPPRVRPRRRKNTVKIPGSGWTAERSPECGSLPLLCRTSTSLGACGWPTGCLVLSSVRGLQMNVCWINGTRSLVERSHECPRRSDQTISMHTRRPCRVWMGSSPSIELNNANGKSVHMPRRIAQSSNG